MMKRTFDMKKQTSLRSTPLSASIQAMHQVEVLARKFNTAASEITEEQEQLIAAVKEQMAKPSWRMLTRTQLNGGAGQQIYAIRVTITFALDIDSLVATADRTTLDKAQIEAYEQNIPLQNEAVGEIVTAALKPRAFGVSESIDIAEWYVPDEIEDTRSQFSQSTWPVELVLQDDMVHVNFAAALTYLLGYSRVIDPKLFTEQCWAGLSFFRSKTTFANVFHWEDRDLILTVDAQFEPV
jgi:hypothetical protein